MTAPVQDTVLALFLLFCRVGTCLMVLPGFSSPQVPARVRLLIAVACALALAPLLHEELEAAIAGAPPSRLAGLILSELATGLLIGLMGRMFFLALEFIAAAITTFTGYGAIPGTPVTDTEPASPLGSLVTLTATVLIFVADLHLEVIRALHASYGVIEARSPFDTGAALQQIANVAARSFSTALQLGGPFLVYSIVANLLFSLANKLMPQVPIFFISIPFIIFGGLGLVVLVVPELVWIFMHAFALWLEGGR